MRFEGNLLDGYRYWKKKFRLADGAPRYYNHKTPLSHLGLSIEQVSVQDG